MRKSDEICKFCNFWDKNNEEMGKCRIDPPRSELVPTQGVAGPGLSVVTFHPETRPDGWCGKGEFNAVVAVQ